MSFDGYPAPKKKSNFPLILVAIVGGLVLCFGGLIVVALVGDNTKPRPALTGPLPTATSPITPGDSRSSAPAKIAPKKAVLASTFGDGSFTGGKHVAVGDYRTPGASEGVIELCVWTLKNAEGDFIDSGSGNVGEPSSVKIRKGDTIESTGCKPWVTD